MLERRVKVVDFDVAKMLQNYHSNVPWIIQNLCHFICKIPIHVTIYAERLTKIGLVDDDRQIEAELQRNFHLLECSLPKLLNRSSPKFYTI